MTNMSVALIGFGEVGVILAEDLRDASIDLTAWDVLFADSASAPSRSAAARSIQRAASAAKAVQSAEIVISAVTAGQTIAAARAAAIGLRRGAFYLDLNSASPASKQEAAGLVEAAGGRYVEAAVMSPVPPKRIASPILLGGPHAEAFAAHAKHLGFSGARFFTAELGRASAGKWKARHWARRV